MDYPYSIHIAGQNILLHGIFEFLGVFIAFRYYLYLSRRKDDGINRTNRIWIIIAATFGAVLGARVVGSLELVYELRITANKLAYFWGNKTILGGLLGGMLAVEGMKKLIGEKHSSGDLITFPLILGMIIGRIGCYSAGMFEETYGIPTTLPWGMNLGDGLARHPVTLYEIAFLISMWVLLVQFEKRYVLTEGSRFKIFLMAYCLFRFLLDFIKPGWRYAFGLGTIQIAALTGLLYYIRYIVKPSLLISHKR
ncbi:MAG: prolipoprotein diacylglyceryl transferase [Flavipsychrobacter sp.]